VTVLACSKSELRGQSVPSPDRKTYLTVADFDGCDAIHIDGRPWPHRLGVRGAVEPGIRAISCADGQNPIHFEIKPGHTFRFDYWGP
jgi:hypothetical protein